MSDRDFHAAISDLRLQGAESFDSVQLYFIEALAARAAEHQGSVRRVLDGRLNQAILSLQDRISQVKQNACQTSEVAPRLSPLSDLTAYLAKNFQEFSGGVGPVEAGSRDELKTTRYFRNTWSKLSVDKQVTQALGQAPKNAGPINSHMLILRSLVLMRDISPDYLNRFTSYAETLLCLAQGDGDILSTTRKPSEGDSGRKSKVRRVRPR